MAKFVVGDVVIVPFPLYKAGELCAEKLQMAIEQVITIVRGN